MNLERRYRERRVFPFDSHGTRLDYSPPQYCIIMEERKKAVITMRQISKRGREMLAFQDGLAAKYGYKPIGLNLFLGDVREKYKSALPEWCNMTGDEAMPLFSLDGMQLCRGYDRIVIGDYGAFVEISPEYILQNNLCCKVGQEYRITDERYAKNVKYLWLTAADNSDCKIYLQKKQVDYADYVPGMYYISPYEVVPGTEVEV